MRALNPSLSLQHALAAFPVLLALASCAPGGYGDDKTVDRGVDRKSLADLQAGIWVDPNGCDHWIIDDGFEGYLSARLDKYGKPVCSAPAVRDGTNGNFKAGSMILDPN